MDKVWVELFFSSLCVSLKNAPIWFLSAILKPAYDAIIAPKEVFWTAMSTIGTLFLAVVALWKENMHRQPELVLEPENMEGVSAPLRAPSGQMIASCYYHLRVKNLKPKVLAKNVRILVKQVQLTNPGAVRELHPPRQLTWAPAELGELAPSFSRERTVDLICVTRTNAQVVLVSAAFSGEHIIDWGRDATILLEVVADNFSKPRFYRLICKWLAPRPPATFDVNPRNCLSLELTSA
ncbi:MAG: hypothetical protein WC133_00435 [Candidatus Omnitrophota bacterium]